MKNIIKVYKLVYYLDKKNLSLSFIQAFFIAVLEIMGIAILIPVIEILFKGSNEIKVISLSYTKTKRYGVQSINKFIPRRIDGEN